MNISIQSKSSEPIYEQIKNQIKNLIFSGELKEGDMLPSIRNLARDLKISVITTKRAYEELESDGLIYSVAGKGFYVDNPNLDFLAEKRIQDIDEQLARVLRRSREAGLTIEQVKEMVGILWEE